MKINWFKILIYLSLAFLIIFLIKSDLLEIPVIVNIYYIIVAVVLLVCAFLILCIRWHRMLTSIQLPVKFKDAVISCGLSIYAKYIPGKLLMIFGKTAHIKKKYKYKTDSLIVASFNDQLIAIWSGLLLGLISFFYIKAHLFLYITFIILIVFSISIFTDFFHSILKKVLRKLFKKEQDIRTVSINTALKLLPYHFAYWLLVGLGFYFLFRGLHDSGVSVYSVFIFPLSVVLGIISFISPGGLGVREAILVAFFTINYNTEMAVSISAASRLWFLSGETIIFLTGFVLYQINRKK